MSGEEADLPSARKIPDSLKCLAGGGWDLQKPFKARRAQAVPHCWALHMDFEQRIKYPKLQKVVVVQEFLFSARK